MLFFRAAIPGSNASIIQPSQPSSLLQKLYPPFRFFFRYFERRSESVADFGVDPVVQIEEADEPEIVLLDVPRFPFENIGSEGDPEVISPLILGVGLVLCFLVVFVVLFFFVV